MDNLNLISNFAEFKELKNIDKSTFSATPCKSSTRRTKTST